MTKEFAAYRRFYPFCRFLFGIFFRIKIIGRELIPAGAAVVCANHSSNLDPFLAAFAFGRERHLRIMGKIELFRLPVIGAYIRRIGMFPVDRGNTDVSAVRTVLKLLKGGEKVMIFPEGTRVSRDDSVAAKNGAVRMAEKMNVPVIPVYIPRKKPIFRKLIIVIGKPFNIKEEREKTGCSDTEMADRLMGKIKELRPC